MDRILVIPYLASFNKSTPVFISCLLKRSKCISELSQIRFFISYYYRKCLIFFFFCHLQIVVWRFLNGAKGSDVLATKKALVIIVFLQYIPRFLRFLPLMSELKKTAGVFAETAWAGAVYYLLWFLLSSHVSCSTYIN